MGDKQINQSESETGPQTEESRCRKPSLLQCVILGAFAINTFFTYLGNSGKVTNGCTNGSQSDKYYTLITPPGWAFAIWALIFVWEGIACVVAFLPMTRNFSGVVVDKTFAAAWASACLFQSIWALVFCNAVKASFFILVLVWLSLLVLQQTSLTKLSNATGTKQRIAVYLGLVAPFSLHLGWVTAATMLNLNVYAITLNASADSLVALAYIALLLVFAGGWTFGVTGLAWSKSRFDPLMAAAVIWAINAVSHHDTTKPIKTSDFPDTGVVFDSSTTKPLATTAHFAFIFLLLSLWFRVKIEVGQLLKPWVMARCCKPGQPAGDDAYQTV